MKPTLPFFAVLALALSPLWARAHDAVTGWRYPATCCSARDCYHMEPVEVSWTLDGWRIEATGEVVPFDRTRGSPDQYFHRCSSRGDRSKPTKGKNFNNGRCLWVPAGGA